MSSEKEFTVAEVAKHNSPNDLWLIIDDKVYDVTSFRDEHPGGGDFLDEEAGMDATESFEDVGHSEDAVEILKKHFIGILKK